MKILAKTAVASALGFMLAASANAAVITFDEFAADNSSGAMPAARYSSLGVTFLATDDGATWGGISNGDPGNWDLDGTNGPIFSGFNGSSYGLTMLFGTNISGFMLDASRSLGSVQGDTFTLEGWDNGSLVESTTITFGGINQWSTLALGSSVDEVRWLGNGAGFHPFGIDNVRWNESRQVPEPGSLALVGIGVAGASVLRRRKKGS